MKTNRFTEGALWFRSEDALQDTLPRLQLLVACLADEQTLEHFTPSTRALGH